MRKTLLLTVAMRVRRFSLALPQNGLSDFDLSRDRSVELKSVEGGR